jgi:hypothetical protein
MINDCESCAERFGESPSPSSWPRSACLQVHDRAVRADGEGIAQLARDPNQIAELMGQAT